MTAVFGFATSHGPMLSTPPTRWEDRAREDRKNTELQFEGKLYDFESLKALRASDDLAKQCSPAEMENQHERCQSAIAEMASRFSAAGIDRAIIIGNDHKESFSDECFGAITVYSGGSILQVPFTAATIALMVPGTELAREGHTPPQPASHPGEPQLADAFIAHLNDRDFDVARSTILPPGKYSNRSIPHAFGFIYRRIMLDKVVPNVPVFVNTFYPPNRVSIGRSVALGQELGRFLKTLDDGKRTAVFASGGLSHFVVEEEFDRFILDAMGSGDLQALTGIDEARLESGTSEIRCWLVLAAAMIELGLTMDVVDYVPCYRSEAGTGSGMGFVTWS